MINKSFKRVAFPCLALMAAPAYSASVLEEITVTAQKREQNLQDVSVSVAAFSGDTLKELGVQDPKDVANFIPNVTVQSTENFPSFNIRGVQLLDFGDGNESPISFYIDEVYYGSPAGQTAGLFDVERAEVLRGPQGTLFGRNSTGGLVHFITKKPTDEFQASGSLELASDNEVITKFAVSGGLSDTVRGRLAGKSHKRDGWQTSAAGQETGEVDSWSLRGMLEVDLSDSVTALFTVSHSDIDNVPAGITSLGLNDPNIGFPAFPGAPFNVFPVACGSPGSTLGQQAVLNNQCVDLFGNQGSTDPEKPGTTVRLNNDTEISGASVKLTWDVNDNVELVSITAYNTLEKSLTSDADGTPLPIGRTTYNVESEAFSQEIRLSGSTDTMTWITGAFYYDEQKDPLQFVVDEIVAGAGGNPFGANGDATLDTKSWAVFGQTEFTLSDQLTLIAGLRYTDEQKELTIANDLNNPSLDPATGLPFIDKEEIDEEEVTGRIGLDWRPDDDSLVFLSIATGYKSGAFNTAFPIPGSSVPSDSETVVNYEIGYKTSFLDDSVRFNTSVFYSDYSDLQAVNVPPGTIAAVVDNVGDADIYGLEVEVTWLASDNLDVMFSLGMLDSEIDSNNQFDGNEMPYTPSLSSNALIRYEFPFAVFDGTLAWTNAFRYVDEHFQTAQNEFTSVQDEYTIWDTVLRWNSAGSTYFVELFVKNVGDKEYTVDRYSVQALGIAASSWERVRHGGIRVGFDF